MYRVLIVLAATLLYATSLQAQKPPVRTSYWENSTGFCDRPNAWMPESARHERWYTVAGERDGPSMFPRVSHPEVEYEAGERLTFDRYHTVDVMYTWLCRWAEQYSSILEVVEVGRSFEGRPILQAIVTSKATGRYTDKPAAYFDGGRHAGEITPSESVLWLLQHLLTNYGRDRRITQLLDSRTIYIRPQHNPDGSNLYLHTAQRNRSSVRPVDQDGDGLLDANPPVDLTNDGTIRLMRWQVEPGEGTHVLDDRDPTGRLMRRVRDGEGDWRVETEGIDHVGDGRYGSDGVGGLDLHRNLLANWRPMPGMDETGRGYTQLGAGEHPLSESEQYSMVMWMLTHPHIAVVNHMDTHAPFHLRPPSTSFDEDRMYPEDLAWYAYFDSLGVSITGYEGAGNVYSDFLTRAVVSPVTGDTLRPTPLFGHGPDFGYFYYGAIWYGDELWNSMRFADYNDDGEIDDVDRLHWDDNFNEGRCFRNWEAFEHPQLGRVEIGGWRFKFCFQNPPPHLLEEWARKQALFNLEMSHHLPQIEIVNVEVQRISRDADSTTFEVNVSWTNSGRLPTALKQAQLVKIVREDHVRLSFDPELTEGRNPTVRIVDPSRTDKTIWAGWTEPTETKSVRFEVRTYGVAEVEGNVQVLSTRGGVSERAIRLRR